MNGLNNDEFGGIVTDFSSNILCDCDITNWQNFGAAAFGGNYISAIGCDIHQHEDALSGTHQAFGGNSNPWIHGNRHGPVRLDPGAGGVMDTTHFRCNSLFSRTGWSLNSPADAVSMPPTTVQPALRFGPVATTRHHHSFDRNAFEGTIAIAETNEISGATLGRNIVFDKFLLVGGHSVSGYIFSSWPYGLTARNGYSYRPNVTRSSSNAPENDFGFNLAGTTPGAGRTALHNITIYSDALSGFYNGSYEPVEDNSGNDLINENNVFYIPSLDLGDGTGDEPAYTFSAGTLEGFVPRDKGARWNFPTIGGPSLGSAISVTSIRENAGGTAIEAGTVANNEWVRLDYPDFTGLCNGAGMADVRAAILANTTQKHVVSITSVSTKRMGDDSIWADADGLVTFDFTNAGYMRIQNNTGASWTSGEIQVLLDLSDELMDFVPGTASPSTIPDFVPAADSDAIMGSKSGTMAWGDFNDDTRKGEIGTDGKVVKAGQLAKGAKS
jgi:hypothetical protein